MELCPDTGKKTSFELREKDDPIPELYDRFQSLSMLFLLRYRSSPSRFPWLLGGHCERASAIAFLQNSHHQLDIFQRKTFQTWQQQKQTRLRKHRIVQVDL